MANYCWNNITVTATDSEWEEIESAFNSDRIEWALTMDGVDCSYKEISCSTKWSPRPWLDGNMSALSESYPTAMFYYQATYEGDDGTDSAWFCNGEETNKKGAASQRKQAYSDEVRRFVSSTPKAAEGIDHRVEIMPDGRVAADGENRFGECNIFDWHDVKQISCGNWHTVGLCADGSLVAGGSNANGQCELDGLLGVPVSVSCGRYHTAILLDTGRVIIRGNLEQEAVESGKTVPLTPADFPIIEDLVLNKYVSGWEQMNERIEGMFAGDALTLRAFKGSYETCFEVLNDKGEVIGQLSTDQNESLSKTLKNVKASVESVTPLSVRKIRAKNTKYAAMKVRLEYLEASGKRKKKSSAAGDYTQTRVTSWPAVSSIKSIFDAVIGVTDSGELYIDGFCPCSEEEIRKYVGLD